MLAEEVASCLPAAKLAAVTRNHLTGEIYGVVYRGSHVGADTVRVKAWLLRLSENEHGHFYWDDFVPVCKSCKNTLLPFDGEERCPICKGQKGQGKCFQFDCRENCLRYACGKLPGARPTYCGSHPFFGGYRLPDQVFGDEGPALWEEEVHADSRFTVCIASTANSEVFVFPGKRTAQDAQRTKLLVLNENGGPSIISSSKFPEACGPYASAVVFAEFPHIFSLTQEFNGDICIWRWVKGEDRRISGDKAVVSAPTESSQRPRLIKQMVSLRAYRYGGYWAQSSSLMALSEHSLWMLDLSKVGELPNTTTAADLANKVSWRKVMDLPFDLDGWREWRDYFSARSNQEDVPPRLLAPGPQNNQVIIFQAKGSSLKPWLLVELRGDAEPSVTEVTSTVSVPLRKREELYEVPDIRLNSLTSEHCSLLPSVFRMNRRHSGYLFFDERGRTYHLRDEEILLRQDDWVAPSFSADPLQRVVTFKFPGDYGGAARSCLFSVLSRFEYFQKALGNWQEGASAEVVVTDATAETFDLLLHYFHTGSLDSELSLESLMGLLELGNKYLLAHLMALCMARILRLLADGAFVRSLRATLMADLLILGGDANACGPFKFKIMDAIASSRPSLTHDAAFLSRVVSARSVDLLAHLLSVFHPKKDLFESVPKRRKIQCERQEILWGEDKMRDVPTWSASRLPCI
eukprot:s246_g8.t1